MTDDGRKAAISFFYPDHKGETIELARHFGEEFVEQNPLLSGPCCASILCFSRARDSRAAPS